MSQLTPHQIEALREKMLADVRSEKRDPKAVESGLEGILNGSAAAESFDSESDKKSPWLKRGMYAGALGGLLFLGWQFSREVESEDTSVEVMQPKVEPVQIKTNQPIEKAVTPAEIKVPAPIEVQVVEVVPEIKPNQKVPKRAYEEVDSLARELTLLDEARKTLKSDAEQTLLVLNRYSAQFPKGALRTESLVLRVEAFLRADRRAEAELLAAKLMQNDSEGLVRERVQRLLKEH